MYTSNLEAYYLQTTISELLLILQFIGLTFCIRNTYYQPESMLLVLQPKQCLFPFGKFFLYTIEVLFNFANSVFAMAITYPYLTVNFVNLYYV